MLATAERSWLEEHGEVTLGLTHARVRVLLAVLERDQFSFREIGRAAGQTSEGVRAALDTLTARELIEFYAVGPTRGRNAAYHASPGVRLRLLFDRLLPNQGIGAGQITLHKSS